MSFLGGEGVRTPRTAVSDDHFSGFPVSVDDKIIEKKGIAGYRDMRRDAEVAADVDIRLTAMIPGLQILPADGDEIAKQSTQLIQSVMTAMYGQLEYVVRDQMLDEAISTGLLVAEPIEQIVEIPDFGSVIGLETIYTRPAEGFVDNIEVNDYGRVTKLIQDTMSGPISIDPADVIYWAYKGQPWNPYGRSIFHSAYDYWVLKRALMRLFSEFSTVNASGIKEYVIPDNMFQKDKDTAYERLKALAGRANIVRKKGHELVIHIPPGTAGYNFIRGIRELCNVEIRKAFLYDETINAEGMRTGSKASREVSEKVTYAVLQSQGYAYCEAIAEQLFRYILDRNGYTSWPTPKLVPEPVAKKDADPAPILQAVTQAYTAGVFITIPDTVRDQLLRQTVRPLGIEYDENAGDVAQKKDAKKETKAMHFANAPAGRTKQDVLKLKREAVLAEKKAVADVTETWTGMLPDIKRAFNSTLFDRSGKWKTKDYSKLREVAESTVTKGGSKLRDTLTENFINRYDQGRGDAKKIIPIKAAVNVVPVSVDPVAARRMLSQRVYLTMHETYGSMSNDIYYILENAINGGISEREAMAQISSYLDTHGFTAGRATTIVNTSLSGAYNSGRMSLFNQIADPYGESPGGIIGYQFSAILDDATTDLCANDYDGRFFHVDDPNLPEPPLHYGCRSVLLPVFTGEEPWGSGEWTSLAESKQLSAGIPEGFGGT